MISIINRQRKHRANAPKLRRLLERLCIHYGHAESDVTLVLAGERSVRTLNRRFRGVDRATDVLSFPINEKSPDGRYRLGDIIISMPTAFRRARAHGHSPDREIRILALHGFLHLVGFDHEKSPRHLREEERARRLFLEE